MRDGGRTRAIDHLAIERRHRQRSRDFALLENRTRTDHRPDLLRGAALLPLSLNVGANLAVGLGLIGRGRRILGLNPKRQPEGRGDEYSKRAACRSAFQCMRLLHGWLVWGG